MIITALLEALRGATTAEEERPMLNNVRGIGRRSRSFKPALRDVRPPETGPAVAGVLSRVFNLGFAGMIGGRHG